MVGRAGVFPFIRELFIIDIVNTEIKHLDDFFIRLFNNVTDAGMPLDVIMSRAPVKQDPVEGD